MNIPSDDEEDDALDRCDRMPSWVLIVFILCSMAALVVLQDALEGFQILEWEFAWGMVEVGLASCLSYAILEFWNQIFPLGPHA